MSAIRSSSDLQRNMGEIYEFCRSTREPVYVTRNGEAALVVMDAAAFDDLTSRQDELAHELEVYRALMQSELDRLGGRASDWSAVRQDRDALVSREAVA